MQIRKTVRKLVFGARDYSQRCSLGLVEPQNEISVFLHGAGVVRNITLNHLMACGAPLTFGIGGYTDERPAFHKRRLLRMTFQEGNGERRLLGEVGLRLSTTLSLGARDLHLFHIANSRNYCVPTFTLWRKYLHYAYLRRRTSRPSDVPINEREIHAMNTFCICPLLVVLASVSDGENTNIFPMNLMGGIGENYFAFGLNRSRAVTNLVLRAGQIAVSSLPLEEGTVAYSLGGNHRRENIDCGQLPFALSTSSAFALPIPRFALRVREMQIESAETIGSHMLFIAKIVRDEHRATGPSLHMVHGFYQAWRERHGMSEQASFASHAAGF